MLQQRDEKLHEKQQGRLWRKGERSAILFLQEL